MIFDRIYHLLANSLPITLYALFCTFVLCMAFQFLFLSKARRKTNLPFSLLHFIGAIVFLLYLLVVYRVTGMGTIWDIGRFETLIRWDEIYLIPFEKVWDRTPYYLNIVMTIPLGLLLPLIWPRFRSVIRVAFTGLFLSLLIELSQLLNHRNTMTSDLITNTLGAIVGYLVFRILYEIIRAVLGKNKRKPKREKSFLIRNEAIFYLILSFLGMFLFFNPWLFS